MADLTLEECKVAMKRLCKNALDVQNADNLSGVVHSFSRDMTTLWEIARAEGWASTDKINTHPVAVLYATQIEYLTSCAHANVYSKAFNACSDIVEGKSAPEKDK